MKLSSNRPSEPLPRHERTVEGEYSRENLRSAKEVLHEELSIDEAASNYQGVVSTLSNIGGVYRKFGDETKAREYRAQAEKVRAEHNVPLPSQRVSGGVLDGKAKHREKPMYPLGAGRAGIQGAVVVEVTVAGDGKVEAARAISGPSELPQAAVDAVKQWTFEQTFLDGEPVRIIGTITFTFSR